MKKGTTLFLIGLIMFMFGIYLSTWSVIGTIIGIAGGLVMGSCTLATKKTNS
jgi:hypothetical protein